MGEDVVDFAWARGYIFLFHYGGTTGVAQVNDTDCHQAFESTYFEFEQDAVNQRQLIDPGNINRSPRDVLDDAVATWRAINHEQGVEGFKRTGASIALDGSEDGRICREALECWDEIGMPALRDEALAEVDEAFESKGLTFKDWRTLIKNPDDLGVMEEGDEFEGELEAGEPQWVADGEKDLLAKLDDQEMGDEIVLATTSIVIEAVPGDDAEDLAEAALAAKRLACLEKLRAIAISASAPVSRATAEASISRLRRGRAGRSKKENAALRRHTAKAHKAEHEKLLHKRGVQQKASRDRANIANVLAVQRAAKAKDMAGTKRRSQTRYRRCPRLSQQHSVAPKARMGQMPE